MPNKNNPETSRRAALRAKQASERTARRTRLIISIAIGVALLSVIGFGILQAVTRPGQTASTSAPVTGAQADLLVRENSLRLNDVKNPKATFVEFLDFECEACGAAFPSLEELRQTYGDRVSFVIRYFPLQSHFNSMRSARAVEAAAQQGQLVAMYTKVFQNQKEWAEQQVPKDDVFRRYAQELNLDMARWDTAYKAPETEARIQSDANDGLALGVDSTPTFYFNGKLIEPKSFSDLTKAFDQALAE